jgi:NAD(P)-dependent dehydrogenase (short-subunit alcohol dehydrogenase family)
MSLAHKVVIVTGATSGIGLAAAEAFGREQSRVVLVGRSETALSDATRSIAALGAGAVSCAADITSADSPDRIVKTALDAFGGIDVLVNAAGVIATGTLENTPDETWDAMMDVNLRAPFRLMRAAAPQRPAIVCRRAGLLREQGGHGSSDTLCGARDGATRGTGECRQPRRHGDQPASPIGHGRGAVLEVPGAIDRDPPARPPW